MNIFKTMAVKSLEEATRAISVIYSPNPDALIECLPSWVGPGNPPRYPPAVYRGLVLEFYNANYYFHRKEYRAGYESLT
jgi:hypothetical protein